MSELASTDEIYVLKQGALHSINSRLGVPLSFEEIEHGRARYQLLIDDSYFFYIAIGKLSVSRKKLNTVVANYLQSLFPMDLFAGFALENKNGFYTALIYKQEFADLLREHGQLFRMARKISTAFCELSSRYESFLFTDNSRVYEKDGNKIDLLQATPAGTLRADDIYGDILPFKTEISLRGVKATDMYRHYKLAGIFAGVCYLLFLASGIMDVQAVKKLDGAYQAQLEEYYAQAGVAESADPYGSLRAQVEQRPLAPFRVLDILHSLGQAVPESLNIEHFNINERLIRIEGFTTDFAQMEQLIASMEERLQKKVTLEDSRQAEDGQIKFVIRYEP
jgi:hypothetical protein